MNYKDDSIDVLKDSITHSENDKTDNDNTESHEIHKLYAKWPWFWKQLASSNILIKSEQCYDTEYNTGPRITLSSF